MFSQLCGWRFHSSGTLRCVAGHVMGFRHPEGTLGPWRWRHYIPSKRWERITRARSIILVEEHLWTATVDWWDVVDTRVTIDSSSAEDIVISYEDDWNGKCEIKFKYPSRTLGTNFKTPVAIGQTDRRPLSASSFFPLVIKKVEHFYELNTLSLIIKMLLFAPDCPINQYIHKQIYIWTVHKYTEFSDYNFIVQNVLIISAVKDIDIYVLYRLMEA
jgi:hypothetical protein